MEIHELIKTIVEIEVYKKDGFQNIYSPIELFGRLLYEKKRTYSSQFTHRLNYFPDFGNESILDIGCNTGFLLQQFRKKYNGRLVGIDASEKLIELAKLISQLEQTNIEYYKFKFMENKTPQDWVFDNSLFLSITSPFENNYNINFDAMIDSIRAITIKAIFIEPTNHHSTPVDKLKLDCEKYFSKWGKPEFLGVTDYQNRVLYKINLD